MKSHEERLREMAKKFAVEWGYTMSDKFIDALAALLADATKRPEPVSHYTQREFQKVEFYDSLNSACSLQESSLNLGKGPHLWLGLERGEHLDSEDLPIEHPKEKCLARMHLSQEDVMNLLPRLIQFAKTGELS